MRYHHYGCTKHTTIFDLVFQFQSKKYAVSFYLISADEKQFVGIYVKLHMSECVCAIARKLSHMAYVSSPTICKKTNKNYFITFKMNGRVGTLISKHTNQSMKMKKYNIMIFGWKMAIFVCFYLFFAFIKPCIARLQKPIALINAQLP